MLFDANGDGRAGNESVSKQSRESERGLRSWWEGKRNQPIDTA
jgi:hypothetical protein